MSVFKDRPIDGVIPATLLAFDTDMEIDEAASRRHLRDVAATEGLSAITVNGHASEVHACGFDEQQRILEFCGDELGGRLPLINGIYADGSLQAARLARMAERAGAQALLIFPPNSMIMGGQLRPEMAVTHFKTIAEATDLPLIAFQYPQVSGQGYPFDTLLGMIEAVPSITAVKDWSNDAMLHERHIRSLQSGAAGRTISVLTTHSSWLMASLSMGANGLLSGAGSVMPELQVALFRAVKAGDLPGAQAINDRIYPLAQAFYTPPFLDMHNRMKECLVLLGRQDRAVVRPPLMKLTDGEIKTLGQALDAAGLLPRAAAE
ncbi:MAG: dihydrodipicolinate synthase family protein [Alphaproteobacteria bacterium]|nr:dihydrodipicolinate synthase family protein [Alphaproteobacteria bacterium]